MLREKHAQGAVILQQYESVPVLGNSGATRLDAIRSGMGVIELLEVFEQGAWRLTPCQCRRRRRADEGVKRRDEVGCLYLVDKGLACPAKGKSRGERGRRGSCSAAPAILPAYRPRQKVKDKLCGGATQQAPVG